MKTVLLLVLLGKALTALDKWKFRAFRELHGTEEISTLLEEAVVMQPNLSNWEGCTYDPRKINTNDPLLILMQFERIAKILADYLYTCGLIDSHERYLEAHCNLVASGIKK